MQDEGDQAEAAAVNLVAWPSSNAAAVDAIVGAFEKDVLRRPATTR